MRSLLVLALAACGSTSETTTGPGSSGSGSAGAPIAPSGLAGNDPAAAVVEQAFGKHRPVLPMLSKDGGHAVVEIVTPVRRTGGSTYAVGFVTAGADEWSGGEIELTTIVDGQLLALLVEARETSTPATYNIDAVTSNAQAVTKRIADGGFRNFESMAKIDSDGEHTVGPFRISAVDEPTGVITIVVREGPKQKREQIAPIPMGLIADVECLAKPRVRRAFADAARHRMLVHIGWSVPAQCEVPDDKYRLYEPT